MTDLYNALVTDILPDSMENSNRDIAYAYADRAMRRLIIKFAQSAMIYQNLDIQDDKVLNLLAAENKTQYYMDSLDKETKVSLIQNTIRWHQLAGTTEAIQELVKNVFGQAKVSEWFDYGGEPYMIKIESETPYTKEILDLFNELVRGVKPTVATIEEIKTTSKASAKIDNSFGGKQTGCLYCSVPCTVFSVP